MRNGWMLIFVLLFTGSLSLYSQEADVEAAAEVLVADSIPPLSEKELEKISTIKTVYEKQQRSFYAPKIPSDTLKQITAKTPDGLLTMSDEALYWVNKTFDPGDYFYPWVTFKDTVIVNPLYLPLVLRGDIVDSKTIRPEKPTFYVQSESDTLQTLKNLLKPEQKVKRDPSPLFATYEKDKKMQDMAYSHVRFTHPELFSYTEAMMPSSAAMIKPELIENVIKEEKVIPVKVELAATDYDAPVKFIPERRYWQSTFESSLQFAQSHVSKNWHKGGASNMNILGQVIMTYNYNKNKVRLNNRLELRSQFYNAPNDTLRSYKIGNDLLQFKSNLGLQAFKGWHYTLDVTFSTQMFTNFYENSKNKVSAFLAPFSTNVGLGMSYGFNKAFPQYDKHRSFSFNINMAPLSYEFRYTVSSKIDLGRHGFERKKDEDGKDTNEFKHSYNKFGSTVNLNGTFVINRDLRWDYRMHFFTPYDRVIYEFENTVNYSLSRFLSARINMHLRFDDGVNRPIDPDTGKPKYSYFQFTELLTIGFNYRW